MYVKNFLSDAPVRVSLVAYLLEIVMYMSFAYTVKSLRRGKALAESLDISRAFDRVQHKSLIGNLRSFGVAIGLCNWI